jgi:hypothetical protein
MIHSTKTIGLDLEEARAEIDATREGAAGPGPTGGRAGGRAGGPWH